MARTAIEGGCVLADASTTAVDTVDHGRVTILIQAATAGASVSITVGDTADTANAAPAEGDVIDPLDGSIVDLSAMSAPQGGSMISYIGPSRFIKASSEDATVLVLLAEPRMTTPFE